MSDLNSFIHATTPKRNETLNDAHEQTINQESEKETSPEYIEFVKALSIYKHGFNSPEFNDEKYDNYLLSDIISQFSNSTTIEIMFNNGTPKEDMQNVTTAEQAILDHYKVDQSDFRTFSKALASRQKLYFSPTYLTIAVMAVSTIFATVSSPLMSQPLLAFPFLLIGGMFTSIGLFLARLSFSSKKADKYVDEAYRLTDDYDFSQNNPKFREIQKAFQEQLNENQKTISKMDLLNLVKGVKFNNQKIQNDVQHEEVAVESGDTGELALSL